MWKLRNSKSDRKEQKSSHGRSSLPKSRTSIAPASELTPESSQSSQSPAPSPRGSAGGKGACVCGGCTCQNGIADIQALSYSHNSSSADYHINLDAWLDDVNKAVNAAWTKRHMQYADVHVLMICWEENDIPHIDKEMKRLRNVFVDQFGYETHDLVIPASRSDLVIRRKVDDFIELFGHENNLLIVYYAGHASPGVHSGAPPIWHSRNPTGENPGSSFDTSNIQSILARAQDDSPDVLLIYDCCHSLYAHPTNRNSGRAIVECLFAGGFEAKVPIAGPDSFTAALIDELCEAIHSPTPPSVSDLHRGIIDRLQRWKARGIFGSDDAIIKDRITGKVVLTKAVRTTPVHMFLSVNDAPRTIILAPRKQCASEDSELEAIGKSTTTISQSSALPRVLLAVRIVDDEKNTEALKNWLLSAPAEVVVFEKIYQSYSELFLVELPVSVWNMLPRSPAVSFIGFTMGEKALPRLDGSQMTSSIPLQEYQASADITKHSRVHSITQDDEGQQPGIRGNSTDQGHSDSSSLAAIAHPDLQMHHPGSEEDKALVVVLNVADRTLSNAFARLDKTRIEMQIRDDTILTDVLHQVRLLKTAEGMRLVSESDIQKHRTYLLRYLNAKHLVEYDQPWLRISDRLGGGWSRFFGWRDDDERTEAVSQALYQPSTPRSALFDTLNSLRGSSRTALSMDVVPEDAVDTVSPGHPVDEGVRPTSERPDLSKDTSTMVTDDVSYRQYTFQSAAEYDQLSSLADESDPKAPPQRSKEDKGKGKELPSGAQGNEHDPFKYHRDAYEYDAGFHNSTPDEQRDGLSSWEQYDYDRELDNLNLNERGAGPADSSTLDPKFQVHRSSYFQPGEVFKVMWSEPAGARGGNASSEQTDASARSADRLYFGFRRFIVIANDQGHCTCVPILSYGGKGCLKTGVKAEKHGIIYDANHHSKGPPIPLTGEPKLGFRPVGMTILAEGEILKRESRVNYSKLVTVEHNIKVCFIGSIVSSDMDAVLDAVTTCWAAKMHRRKRR